ncbi:hypothetical protein Y032_0413g1010 [Ancylostoma ceylanicum]|uniref:Uncharacterized protein n=1 Tax=Ancylostoma ceylanicum TaxID=53326 RepID=A0A016X1H0_9BILA|nr:hypothetical protein Y032_0413g1010 [Ancylostoma ceylanicum]
MAYSTATPPHVGVGSVVQEAVVVDGCSDSVAVKHAISFMPWLRFTELDDDSATARGRLTTARGRGTTARGPGTTARGPGTTARGPGTKESADGW